MPTAKKHITPAELDAWQASLGLLFPRKPMLRADEIAAPMGVDDRTIARLFEVEVKGRTGERRPWLMGIEFNAGVKDERMTRRYPRDAVILFYALTANYVPADLLQLLFDVLENRTPQELAAILQRCSELLRRHAR
ncbi:MAG: hypothetical protein K0R17_2264 [Rariglobus sp.]|jgi:hypothetical protein|nr:hypothetical protein [Rariglobus sp.]